jgi:uncharacterized beta-barrel protein YwiB (DUF1934 family)
MSKTRLQVINHNGMINNVLEMNLKELQKHVPTHNGMIKIVLDMNLKEPQKHLPTLDKVCL